MRLPTGRRHLLGSVELYGDDLPVDAAAWFEMR
jgi:hypothetical protein